MNEKLIEAMARVLWESHISRQPQPESWMVWPEAKSSVIGRECVDDARAALLALTEGPVFEEMVERACGAYFDGDGYQWDESAGADHVRASMRLALRAALLGDDNVTT